ncbi:MAG: phosphotransferase [Corynebacterium sp.]|nr:phosphotransferase [Corynebacterium sp.]
MSAIATLRKLPNVRRAWPARDGAITFEQFDHEGKLRAGQISVHSEIYYEQYAHDAKLPELTLGNNGTLVVHRYQRRAVVIGEQSVCKYLRANRAPAIARVAESIHHVGNSVGLQIPKVLSTTQSSLEYSKLAGTTLHELNNDGIAAWKQLETLWPEFISQPVNFAVHSAREEAGVLTGWLKKVTDFQALPNTHRFTQAVEDTCRELLAESSDLVLSHRDLHDKQLLWDAQQLSLLDTDTAVRAESALDLGNLLAHAELRLVQGKFSQETSDAVANVVNALSETLGVPLERLAAYLRSSTLRLAFVYAFRPSSAPWLDRWIDHCFSSS